MGGLMGTPGRHRVAMPAGSVLGWVVEIGRGVAAGFLALVCTSVFWSLVPAVFGWHAEVVLSGSMAPRIRPGDVVVVAPATVEDVRPGQVIWFTDPADPGRNLVHRYVSRNADGTLTTKGDANPTPDPAPLPPGMVHGLPRVRVPFVGLCAYWMHVHRTYALLGTAGALLLLVLFVTSGRSGPIPQVRDPVAE
jgi:signal peptidase I